MRVAIAVSTAFTEARVVDHSAVTPELAARVCVIVTDSPPIVQFIPRGFPSNSSVSDTGWFSLTTNSPLSAVSAARSKQLVSRVKTASRHGAPATNVPLFACNTSKPLLSCMQHAVPVRTPSINGRVSSTGNVTFHSTESSRATSALALYELQNPDVGRPVTGEIE